MNSDYNTPHMNLKKTKMIQIFYGGNKPMDDMTKFLRRANLKELACYFTNLDLPIEEDLPPDSTVEELMEEVYGHLEAALLRGERQEIRAVVEEMSDAARWVGLLDGMRVGARLVLRLTGGAPPVC